MPLFCGRGGKDPELIRAAMLLAAFGLVRDGASGSQLGEVAARGNMGVADLRACIATLLKRQVLQRRGQSPCSSTQTGRHWTRRTPVASVGTPGLGRSPSRNRRRRTEDQRRTSVGLVEHNGYLAVRRRTSVSLQRPLDGSSFLSQPEHADVLGHLAVVDPMACAVQIGRTLDELEDLRDVSGHIRRGLVHALHRIAFSAPKASTKVRGCYSALLLMRTSRGLPTARQPIHCLSSRWCTARQLPTVNPD